MVAKFFFICLIWISLATVVAQAQPSSVTLTGLPPLTARPEEFVTTVFTLQNNGTTPETFDLELMLPPGFTQVAGLMPVTVTPGGQEFVFVNVLVPNNAEAADFTVTLTAISRTDPTLRISSQAIIRVVAAARIQVRALGVQEETGDGLTVAFSVRNTGNVADQIELRAESQKGFELELSQQSLELAPGQQTTVQVRIIVPPAAAASVNLDRITLTATSTQFDGNQDSIAINVELRPPLPDQISTALGWVMPTNAAFSFSQSNVPNSFLGLLSLTGGGELNDTDSFDFRLSLDHTFTVRTVAFGTKTTGLELDLGDVSASYDRFVAVSGRGAVLTIETPLNASLSAAAVSQAGVFPVAANFSLDLGDTTIGVSSEVPIRQVPTESVISASLRQSLLQSISLDAQGAFSFSDGLFAPAFLTGAGFSQGPFDLNISLSKFFPNFLGTAQDQQQLQFTQTLGLDQLVLSTLIDIQQDNIGLNPALPTVGRSRVFGVARWFPGERLPTLSAVVDLSTRKNISAITTVDTQSWNGSLSLVQPLNFVSLALSTSIDRTIDNLTGTDTGALTISSLLGWNTNGFSRTIRISHLSNVDFLGLFVTSRSLTLETTLSLRLPIGQLSFGLSNSAPNTTFTSALRTSFPEGTFNVSGQVAFENSTLTGFSVQLNFSRSFGTRLPFIAIKGQIEGVVFLDANGNGQKDDGEGFADLTVVAGGGRVRTDADGFFRLPPLSPGNYLVNLGGLPAFLSPGIELPQSVDLRAGQRVDLSIPLNPMSAIDGLAFNDLNSNGVHDAGELGVADLIVTLTSASGIERQTRTTDQGRFSFPNLTPGEYTVNLEESSLPRRHVLTTPGKVTVQVAPQSAATIQFGVVEQAPEIRFNLTEPTALFTHTPEVPTVGEQVTFDASASTDPDGTIDLYEWDLNGDGVTDAQGPAVTFTYDEAGAVLVILTVTDNDGNTDQESKIIQVSPS